jgi:hypothetical protein
MKKILTIIILYLTLNGCSKSDQDYVELCADQKTSSYWNERANQFSNEMSKWVLRLAGSTDSDERKSILLMIDSKLYYIDLYSNAHKKELNQKIYEFPRYETNFEKCGKEFKDNPVYFKQRYK